MPHIEQKTAFQMLAFLQEFKKNGEFHPNDKDTIAGIIHEILTATEFEVTIEEFQTKFKEKWETYKYPDDWKTHPTCCGCKEGQPNQLAHCYPGGCLYSEEMFE